MRLPSSTEVLIIGAGPMGIAPAISLAQAGADHVSSDKMAAGQTVMKEAVAAVGLCSCAPVLGFLALGAGATAVGIGLSKHPELLSSTDPAHPTQSEEISSAAAEPASVQQIR